MKSDASTDVGFGFYNPNKPISSFLGSIVFWIGISYVILAFGSALGIEFLSLQYSPHRPIVVGTNIGALYFWIGRSSFKRSSVGRESSVLGEIK
jgi:hypothetical protein